MTLRNYTNTSVQTTLVSGIDASETSITVADATGYPAAPFAIVIDPDSATAEEVLLVTVKVGAVFTATRAFDGTTGKTHSAGATVIHAAIAGDFADLQTADSDHAALTTSAHGGIVASTDPRLTDARAPSGSAGGVLGGFYPNPSFAADMATQAELDTEASTRATADTTNASNLTTHAALTTSAHGGIVSSADSRLTDSRTPTAHDIGGALHTGTLTDALHGTRGGGTQHANVVAAGAAGFMTGTDKTKLDGIASGATANTGTVTSVDLTVPSILSVAGSPITTSGTLAVTLATEAANTTFAGPTTGAAATPTFRALVAADLPSTTVGAGAYGTSGTTVAFTVDAAGRLTAAVTQTPAFAASVITSGTLAAARGGIPFSTAFPGSPATSDRFFRTDLGWLCYFDGTRWLTVHDYTFQFPFTTYSATTEDFAGLEKTPVAYAVWPVSWDYGINTGATNTGAAFWTFRLRAAGTATVVSFDTSGAAPNTQYNAAVTAGFASLSTSDKYLNIRAEKTGAASNIDGYFQLRYKLIVT